MSRYKIIYSIKPIDQTFVKLYGFLSIAIKIGKTYGQK